MANSSHNGLLAGGHVAKRPHMPMSERAKIFIPFDPLKGYRELLRERERERLVVEPVDLSDEQREELSRRVRGLAAGDLVAVTHYADGRYERTEGCVTRVSLADGDLDIVGRRIPFGSIAAIERLDGDRGSGDPRS